MAAAPVQQTQTDRDLINMYNEINRLGSNLPSGQITQHQNAYTQIISACRGARGNADEFMRDPQGTLSVAFKAALTENFLGNEASFNNWYRINAPVSGRNMDSSSFTFGPPQWDLGQGSTRVDRLTAILQAHQWPQSRIDDVNRLLTQHRAAVLNIYQHRNDPGSQASRDWNTITDLVREADQVLLQEAANGVNSGNLVWANYYGYTDPGREAGRYFDRTRSHHERR